MADTKWMQKVEKALGDTAVRSHRRPAVALSLALLFSVLGGYFTYQLPLIADLEKLLPDSFESVKGLEQIKARFGGVGYVVIVGINGDTESLKRFADEYGPRVEKELPGIRYVDYKRAGGFFEDRSLYYLSLEDLQTVAGRIKDREKYERRQANPMFVKLDDEEVPSLDMSDIEEKYGKRSDQRLASGGDYYLDENEKMVVLLAKPMMISADLNFTAKIVQDTEDYFKKQDLKRFGKDFRVGLTGTFTYKVDQQRQLSADMSRASIIALLFLTSYLLFHFRGILPVFLVILPVMMGLAWTYGLTFFIFGNINILTGFLGAVLGGLGTEHGIHLIGRYSALRAEGHSSEDATRDAFMHTGGSAIVSSLVAALTFVSVAYSEFRAFREFGTIAAIGMMVVLSAYFLILPAALGLAVRLNWKPRVIITSKSEVAALLPRAFRPIALIVGGLLIIVIARMPGVHFDYDFRALEDSSLPSFQLDRQVNKILGYDMEPVVILTEHNQSERLLVAALKARKKAEGRKSTIDFVAALDDLVPTEQPEKQALLATIQKTLNKVNAEDLDSGTRPRFDKLLRWVKAVPFARGDIPFSVRRQFEGIKPGEEGGFVLIFPNIKVSDGIAVGRFAKEVRNLELPNGERFSAAGEAMILADVLLMVEREGRPVLIAATLSVLLAMWLTLGSLRIALLCMLPTALSLVTLVGMMTVLDLPFNYLNILLVPVLIGVTVDGGVHMTSRISEGHGNFPPVFAETGRAIVGGLVTSGDGFSAMLFADHPGLNSIGRLAILGFAVNLIIMLLFFPAVLLWLQKRGWLRLDDSNSEAAVPSEQKP